MKNINFDICAGAVFLVIILTFKNRKLEKYRMFSMFYMISVISLVCVAADILMEYTVNPLPLGRFAVAAAMTFSFVYKFLRNATMVTYLIFIFAVTRTDFRIRSAKMRGIMWAPNGVTVFLLIANFWTGWVFRVTPEGGYARGPLLWVLYLITAIYAAAGVGYLFVCRRYLKRTTFYALLFVYVLIAMAVLLQMVQPKWMVEMFATAIGMLVIMMFAVRPEERIDHTVGLQTWKTFQGDLYNTLLARQEILLMVLHVDNGDENREFFGDTKYYSFARNVVIRMEQFFRSRKIYYESYCEPPANLYAILGKEGISDSPEELAAQCLAYIREGFDKRDGKDLWFHPHLCLIRCPEDLKQYSDIISMCHRFHLMSSNEIVSASEIVGSREFEIQNHIDDILTRAIAQNELQMYYQPIYSIADGKFKSAEALARLNDSVYGMIPPDVFIPAAERTGMIEILGRAVIESVFRFMSQHDLRQLGISFIEINLSVAQCVQPALPDLIHELQLRYGIDPSTVNFEITETMVDSLDNVMTENLEMLSAMGYTLSLDDYGMGYSNVRRVRKLPLRLIKIDKSLVDDMFTREGGVILKNTVDMMRGINKQLVMEGVETREALDALKELKCDYIQGFYFSKPLPEDEFLRFIREASGN